MNNSYDAWILDYENETIYQATAVYLDENRVAIYYNHELTQDYQDL